MKYQHAVGEYDARHVVKYGGGLLATRSWEGELGDGAVYALPAGELLALLDAPSLAPCNS